MAIRILTKNAVDNTNIDGARQNNFNAGGRSGIVLGALSGGDFISTASNVVALTACELIMSGHRIVIDEAVYFTLSNIPSEPTRYSLVAELNVDSEKVPAFELKIQAAETPLVQENLHADGTGLYELEIGRFTLTAQGITDLTQTVDKIQGGTGDSGGTVKIGDVVTNTLDEGMDAEVDVDFNEESGGVDFKFSIPAGKPGDAVQQEAIDQLNYQISSIGDGSPKGTYTTLGDLETAYPAGTTGIYVVAADGHWYYWNSTAWTDGGVYQATGIADASVSPIKISDNVFRSIYTRINPAYKIAAIAFGDGNEISSARRIISNFIKNVKNVKFTNTNNDLKYAIVKYNLDYTFIATSGWITNSYYEMEDNILIRAVVSYSDDRDLASSDIDILSSNINIYGLLSDSKRPVPFRLSSEEFEIGTLSSGEPASANTRIRTNNFKKVNKNTVIRNLNQSECQMAIHLYSLLDKSFVSSIGFLANAEYYITENECYIKIVLAYKDNRTITHIDMEDLIKNIAFFEDAIGEMEKRIIENSFKSILGSFAFYDYGDGIKFIKDGINAIIEISGMLWIRGYNTPNTTLYLGEEKEAVTPPIFETGGYKNETHKTLLFNLTDNSYLLYNFQSNKIFTRTMLEKTEFNEGDILLANCHKGEIKGGILSEIKNWWILKSLQDIAVNDTGKEFVFKFYITATYMSGHTFVGNELWCFNASNDNHSDTKNINRYSVDFTNKTATFGGSYTHNLGHCNTVDYCEETDTLILGNGGTSGNIEPDEVYIFENVIADSITDFNISNAITLHLIVDGFEWGKQINALWGESNGGKHNIVYIISNDDATQFIHKILLGQGTNQLENGTFISGKSEKQFNGTYKVLKEYTHEYKNDYCIQGADFYNGILYESISHDRLSHFEKTLCDDGKVKSKLFRERIWDNTGNEVSIVTQGMAIKDGYMVIGSNLECAVYVFKL